ncbi:MAG: serine hydrolase [Bryobacteraceae bacterium]|jgi:CubicO group peptidase (beta-lactamase class C family)
MKICRWLLFFVCSIALWSQDKFGGFDADVERAMLELRVPGVAVGVIKEGKVVLAKGYGVREAGKSPSVDPDTLFAVGSMTKSFTAITVAMMIDEGKLEWDHPVRDYLPWFRMYDPVATELMTPRDLLTHRSGLPRHDFIRFSTPLDREELVRRLRYLEPSRTFRDVYQYNNLMYVTAGFLAGEVAHSTWENLVTQRIFAPLGMMRSTVSVAETLKRENFARPHLTQDDKAQVTEFYDYQRFGVGPNGAVNSTVNDFLKYLQFQLGDGTVGEKRVVSHEQMQQLHRPITVSPQGGGYAPGWEVMTHRGHAVLEHGGSITGFTSMMMLLPENEVGIVVMNNLGSALPSILTNDLADRLLGLVPTDYLGVTLQERERAIERGRAERKKIESERVPGTKPSLEISAYTGEYFHPAYGTIRVEGAGTGLVVHFGALDMMLKHYNFDTFECESEFMSGMAQFRLNPAGSVKELWLPLEPAVKPFVFVKK